MANRLKRVSYSIFLDPLNNPADLYASKVMHQWATERQELESSDDALARHNAIHIHKQIYLSGLFLHLLSPDVTQRLSAQLTEDQVSEFTLHNTLSGLGLDNSSAYAESDNEGVNSHTVVKALSAMLDERDTQQQNALSELFERMQSNAPDTASFSESSETIASELAGQNKALEQQNQLMMAQTRELNQLKDQIARLERQLAKATLSSVQTGDEPKVEKEQSMVANLEDRIANVQRLKKKGIF